MARTRNERKKYDDERKAMLSVVALILLIVALFVSGANALAMSM